MPQDGNSLFAYPCKVPGIDLLPAPSWESPTKRNPSFVVVMFRLTVLTRVTCHVTPPWDVYTDEFQALDEKYSVLIQGGPK